MSIKTEKLEDFPVKETPERTRNEIMNIDIDHMGSTRGENVMLLYPNHRVQHCKYLIVVNTDTGETIKLSFDNKKEEHKPYDSTEFDAGFKEGFKQGVKTANS